MPERVDFNLNPIGMKARASEAGLAFEVRLTIMASQISAWVQTDGPVENIFTLRNYVENTVRTTVDAYGYVTGRGYDVEITSVTYPDGKQVVFGIGIPALEALGKSLSVSFPQLLGLVSKEPQLTYILADLRESIRSGTDTAFHCFRAVEGVRQAFHEASDRDDRSKSWNRLNSALRTEETWVKPVRDIATRQRHGDRPYVSGERSEDMMIRTWKLVDRFLVYLQRDRRPLSGEFGVLK